MTYLQTREDYKKMNCQHCKQNCEGRIESNTKVCKFLYRPNEFGLKEIITKQRQTISRLREEIKLLKEIKHIEFLKQITKERDALIAERIIR